MATSVRQNRATQPSHRAEGGGSTPSMGVGQPFDNAQNGVQGAEVGHRASAPGSGNMSSQDLLLLMQARLADTQRDSLTIRKVSIEDERIAAHIANPLVPKPEAPKPMPALIKSGIPLMCSSPGSQLQDMQNARRTQTNLHRNAAKTVRPNTSYDIQDDGVIQSHFVPVSDQRPVSQEDLPPDDAEVIGGGNAAIPITQTDPKTGEVRVVMSRGTPASSNKEKQGAGPKSSVDLPSNNPFRIARDVVSAKAILLQQDSKPAAPELRLFEKSEAVARLRQRIADRRAHDGIESTAFGRAVPPKVVAQPQAGLISIPIAGSAQDPKDPHAATKLMSLKTMQGKPSAAVRNGPPGVASTEHFKQAAPADGNRVSNMLQPLLARAKPTPSLDAAPGVATASVLKQVTERPSVAARPLAPPPAPLFGLHHNQPQPADPQQQQQQQQEDPLAMLRRLVLASAGKQDGNNFSSQPLPSSITTGQGILNGDPRGTQPRAGSLPSITTPLASSTLPQSSVRKLDPQPVFVPRPFPKPAKRVASKTQVMEAMVQRSNAYNDALDAAHNPRTALGSEGPFDSLPQAPLTLHREAIRRLLPTPPGPEARANRLRRLIEPSRLEEGPADAEASGLEAASDSGSSADVEANNTPSETEITMEKVVDTAATAEPQTDTEAREAEEQDWVVLDRASDESQPDKPCSEESADGQTGSSDSSPTDQTLCAPAAEGDLENSNVDVKTELVVDAPSFVEDVASVVPEPETPAHRPLSPTETQLVQQRTEYFGKMNVRQLRDRCKKSKLETVGNKPELVKRLVFFVIDNL